MPTDICILSEVQFIAFMPVYNSWSKTGLAELEGFRSHATSCCIAGPWKEQGVCKAACDDSAGQSKGHGSLNVLLALKDTLILLRLV